MQADVFCLVLNLCLVFRFSRGFYILFMIFSCKLSMINCIFSQNLQFLKSGEQMLKLNHIVKDYPAGSSVVHALRDVSLTFRRQEFVAILGPSGCGKTTLLNIIGGLDQYTSGDLLISGRSTKQFRDRDWDAYRNHSIGFVFQSYNLIPHQSVLQNVELALTLSGVSRRERRARAVQALERVGLGDQLNKKPNQMSGGQMQRVAIARALVNNPEILLADEPTGALDSETSVQVMEILREISKEKLIIMVTHNPELAERYATRTIRFLDGHVVSDSAPCTEEEARSALTAPQAKTSMSFFTALGLSLNNLMTKKARTLLTAFAGSIGIIGIALILSLSNGIQNYIDQVQEDTLSSYPVTIEAETMDMSTMVTTMMGENSKKSETAHEADRIYASTVMYELMNSFNSAETETNNLKRFKEYLDNPESPIHETLSAIQYSYDLTLPIYTTDDDGNIVKSDVMELMQNMMSTMYGGDYSSYFSRFGSYYTMMDVWEEMLPGENGQAVSELVQSQYDVLYGHWPERYDEVVLIVNENNEISDLVMYAMGLKTENEMETAMQAAMDEKQVAVNESSWSYTELCGRTFKLILPCEIYRYDKALGVYTDLSTTDAGMDYLYHADGIGTTLKISGIVRKNPNAASSMMSGSIGYTSLLTDYVIRTTAEQDIVKKQLDDPATDVLTALPFRTDDDAEPTADEKRSAVTGLLSDASTGEKSEMYLASASVPSSDYLDMAVSQAMDSMTRETIQQQMADSYAAEMGVDASEIQSYIDQMDDETLFSYVAQMVRESVTEQYAEGVQTQLQAVPAEQLAAMLDVDTLRDDQIDLLYTDYVPPTVSDSTYADNLDLLGYVDIDSPASVKLYTATFAGKDAIADAIDEYNKTVSDDDEITYTDYVALLMSSITAIINAISYVLIAFVAISLVVSSIMIGIITYISVLERTKEIGILRAIGASKRDISRVFNAETLIEGLIAGLIGIGLTLVLIIPINAIVRHLTGIAALGAALPAAAGAVLIAISMLLTFIAGLIPSRIAAKKDPVVALRSE